MFKELVIIGSIQCSHCSDADKKAKEMKRKGKNKFKYSFKEYPTIKEAIDEAQKLDKEINAIPAFFIDGKYQKNRPF